MNKKVLSLCATFVAVTSTAYVQAQSNPSIVIQPSSTIRLPAGAAPSALAIADFNADTRADVAVCEQGLGIVGVYLQTTTGTFPSPVGTYPAGEAPSGLVAVRLTDGSSRPPADLVALSGPSSKWTLLMNDGNGQGSFTELTGVRGFGASSISVNPQLVATYMNGDNFIDFAYTYPAPGLNRVKWDSYIGGGHFSYNSYQLRKHSICAYQPSRRRL